jgi:hypothetical protein
MKRFKLIGLTALIAVSQIGVANAKLDGMYIRLTGTLSVNASGAVDGVSLTSTKLPDLDKKIEQKILGWKFNPIMVDGKPANTKIGLDADVTVDFDESGKMKKIYFSSIDYAQAGKGPRSFWGKKKYRLVSGLDKVIYPLEMVEWGVDARVNLLMKVLPDGTISEFDVQSLDILSMDKTGLSARELNTAAKQFSRALTSKRDKVRVDKEMLNENFECSEACLLSVQVNFYTKEQMFTLYDSVNVENTWRGLQKAETPVLPWATGEGRKHNLDNELDDNPGLVLLDRDKAADIL